MQIRLFTLIRIRLDENHANPDPQRWVQGDVTVPDYFDEFSNCDMVWDEKLGLVQDWQLFLTGEPLDDAGDLKKNLYLKTLSPVTRVKECPSVSNPIQIQGFDDQKLEKTYSRKKNFGSKIAIYIWYRIPRPP